MSDKPFFKEEADDFVLEGVIMGYVSNRPCLTRVTMIPCIDLIGFVWLMLILRGIVSPRRHPAFNSSMVAVTPALFWDRFPIVVIDAESSEIRGSEPLGVPMMELGRVPDFSGPFSSDDPCELFRRLRLDPCSIGMTRGFGGGSDATSIISTSATLWLHVRVGEMVIGRVNVAEMLYDIDPFSNYIIVQHGFCSWNCM